MARLALAVHAALDVSLTDEAVRHGHEIVGAAGSAVEAAALVERERPEALIASADGHHLAARLLTACDESGVRVVALAADEGQRRHAASMGLQSVDASAPWPAIERAALGSPRPTPAARSPRRGTVIAVWGPTGAPGRTTLAIGVAAELAALGRSVVLGDVDIHGASVAPALGLLDESPGFAAACRLAGAEALTPQELERIAGRYDSAHGGFRVLTGLGRANRWPELSAERVAGVIAACRAWADVTVLDCASSLEHDEELSSDLLAPKRNAATITAVREADVVVAVGAADPVGMSRFLRAYADLVEVAEGELRVVMNKVRATAIGLNPQAQVAQTLSRFGGIHAPVLVPHDQAALDGAVLSGRTLADSAPRSAARSAIRVLAESLGGSG